MVDRPTFIDQIQAKWDQGKFVCVGLDPDWAKMPQDVKGAHGNRYGGFSGSAFQFLRNIVNETGDLVCAFKPNIAFFEGDDTGKGEEALKLLIAHIRISFPDVPIIGDIKRADIGNTNIGYAAMAFDRYGFDAITVNPYFGGDTLDPFLKYPGKGLFVLCSTTNPGSSELQNMPINLDMAKGGGLVSEEEHSEMTDLLDLSGSGEVVLVNQMVAFMAAKRWNKSGNLGLVVGATHPEAFEGVRRLAPDLPFLIPGIGTQGGDLERTLKYAPNSKGQGIIINSGSAILYASSNHDYAEAARKATLDLDKRIRIGLGYPTQLGMDVS